MLPMQDILRIQDKHENRIADLEGIEIPFQSTIEEGVGGGTGRTLIETKTPSGISSVTFASIPQTFTHLDLRWIAQADGTSGFEDIFFEINGNTTLGDYKWTLHEVIKNLGAGSDVHGLTGLIDSNMPAGFIPNSGNADVVADEFGWGIADFLFYTEPDIFKIALIRSGSFISPELNIDFAEYASIVFDGAAITTIVFGAFNELFEAGTEVSLFGID